MRGIICSCRGIIYVAITVLVVLNFSFLGEAFFAWPSATMKSTLNRAALRAALLRTDRKLSSQARTASAQTLAQIVTPRQTQSNAATSFFQQIGSPKYICAPMVEHSDLPFRMLTRRHGTDLAFSQMLNVNSLYTNPRILSEFNDWEQYENYFLSEHHAKEAERLDKNIIVQLAGDDAPKMIAVAKLLEHRVAAVDVNLGCPQKIAKKGNYGAYLLPQIDLVCDVLSSMVRASSCPVTAKVRILPDKRQTIENCLRLQETGISMLTVHGRTRESNKQYVGAADWDIIAEIKRALHIPVIANGGIEDMKDAEECLLQTGCDGVMSAEGLLGNPKMFCPMGSQAYETNFIRTQLATVDEYFALLEDVRPERLRDVEYHAKSHLFKLLHRFMQAPRNVDLRGQLATKHKLEDTKPIFEELKDRICKQVDLDDADHDSDEFSRLISCGLVLPSDHSWYSRHRSTSKSTQPAHERE
jgi:tRNA-dihydrouridine synthase 1